MSSREEENVGISETDRKTFNDYVNKRNSEGYVDKTKLIVGAARTEHVIEMGGNANKYKGETLGQLRDMKMNLDGEEVEISEHAFVSPYAYKYALRLDDKPVNWNQIFNLDPALRMTKGVYMIKYVPKGSKDHRKGRPWKIGQDLIRWDIRVSGPKEWHELAKRVPEIGWLERNSTLNDRMFDLAVRHPGMSFWFSVDWIGYEDKLQAQSKSVLKKPFVSRKCSVAEYRDKHKAKDKAVLIRYFNDILKEVNEVEKLPSVQEEMLTYANEGYDRSRKCPRDPVTGRFIKKEDLEKENVEYGDEQDS